MARARSVLRIGVPVLVLAVLTVVALLQVGAPRPEPQPVGTAGVAPPRRADTPPLTRVADVSSAGAIGREAALEATRVVQVTSPRTFWVGSRGVPAFAVLDPDVKRVGQPQVQPGARVTLIGLVRPAPTIAWAVRQWQIDDETAHMLLERGTYLHVTELREK